MFESFVARPKRATERNRWLTTSVSLLAHVVVLGALVIAPLTAITTPPAPSEIPAFVAPEYPPIARAAQVEGAVVTVTLQFHLADGHETGGTTDGEP